MRTRMVTPITLAALGLALAACGGGDSAESDDSDSGAAATEAPTDSEEAGTTDPATPQTVPAPSTTTTIAPATTTPPTTVPEPDEEWFGLMWESGVDPSRVNAADVPRPSWQEAGVLWELDLIAELPASDDECAAEMDSARSEVSPAVAATEQCLVVQLRWDVPGSPLEIGYASASLASVIRPDSQSVDAYAYESGDLGTVDNGLVAVIPFTPAGSVVGFSFSYSNDSTDVFEYSDVRWQTPTPDQLRPMNFGRND